MNEDDKFLIAVLDTLRSASHNHYKKALIVNTIMDLTRGLSVRFLSNFSVEVLEKYLQRLQYV